jgi:hypothetical protein
LISGSLAVGIYSSDSLIRTDNYILERPPVVPKGR